MQRTLTALLSVLCAVSLLPLSAALKVHINMNQFPSVLTKTLDPWQKARSQIDGVWATGAPNPYDPMDDAYVSKFVNLFPGKAQTFICLWSYLTGQVNGDVNFQTVGDEINQKWPALKFGKAGGSVGFTRDMFVWDYAGLDGMLSIGQLDQLQRVGFQKILLNTRGFREYPETVKQRVLHPQVKGVVIEAAPYVYKVVGPVRELAKFVKATGKPLFILAPPSPAKYGSRRQHILDFVDLLIQDLGLDFFCSDKLTVIMAAYRVQDSGLPFLPEKLPSGRAAETFFGHTLLLIRQRRIRCDNRGSNTANFVQMQTGEAAHLETTTVPGPFESPSGSINFEVTAQQLLQQELQDVPIEETPTQPMPEEGPLGPSSSPTGAASEISTTEDSSPASECFDACISASHEMCDYQCQGATDCLCTCKTSTLENCSSHCGAPIRETWHC